MNKQILFLLITAATWFGCTQKSDDHKTVETAPISVRDWAENATIYEVNLRHYTPEGTIQAFIPHLDRLQNLGVDVLWIMPIHPVGAVKRKATGDQFVEDLEGDFQENLKAYPGSPYSVQNYRAVNPDYGTVADMKQLIAAAHERGMKVILDWVANHTAWDHAWITDHPDWYTQKDGHITDPLDENGNSVGWNDVADLNYDNKDLWEAMTSDMKFWVDSCDLDGFRCDVAFFVPETFWKHAVTALEEKKDMFMLAEAEGHNMKLYDGIFDMYYAWNVHHQMNELSKGNITTDHFIQEWQHVDSLFGDKAFPMNFITNHDENSWNGTEFERMGDAWKMMAVLSYALKGMPLIYSGQEVGLNRRLPFFTKDQIDWHKADAEVFTAFYTQLNELKLDSNLTISTPIQMSNDEGLLTIKRGSLTFVMNTSEMPKSVPLESSIKQRASDRYEHQMLQRWGYIIY